MYDNYDKILDRVRGIIVQELKTGEQERVLAELERLQYEIEETISGRLEQMSADEQD
jgi:hypothetical protein